MALHAGQVFDLPTRVEDPRYFAAVTSLFRTVGARLVRALDLWLANGLPGVDEPRPYLQA